MKTSELSPYELAFQAEAGDPGAQFTLGMLFLLGEKVNQDLEAAHRWFSRAAEAHHPGAERLAKRLARLKQNEVNEAVSSGSKGVWRRMRIFRFLTARPPRVTTQSIRDLKETTPRSNTSAVADPA